jgi:NAD(P)-dependent dehydrogenase (short-subunit alcohol dehydrogenase family)
MDDLTGKTVLVTGGGTGIGRSIALAYTSRKASVVVVGRNQSRLEGTAQACKQAGAELLPLRCDVTEKEEVEALKLEISERLGAVEILVNNAGTAPAANFLEMEDRLWRQVLDVNLNGTYRCCKVFLPDMIASGWGRIINIASTVARTAYPSTSAYATSKHAVLGLTRSLAVETARRGITVNAICPGYVDTELTRHNAELMAEKSGKTVEDVLRLFASTSPQKRLITPEEVAFVAVSLSSELARGITGQGIQVDGGTIMA